MSKVISVRISDELYATLKTQTDNLNELIVLTLQEKFKTPDCPHVFKQVSSGVYRCTICSETVATVKPFQDKSY